MPAWEYSLFLQEINNLVKEDNERQQKEMDKAGYDKKMTDPKYAKKIANKNMSNIKTPKMPGMPSMPKF